MLVIKNISKTYNKETKPVVALDNVSINFPNTGLVFIIGKSGAGKSTLLNILGGLDKQDSGNLLFDNKDSLTFQDKDFDDLRNYKIGFIFQEFNLLDNLSVYENVAISLKIQSKEYDITEIDEILKLVNLEGLGYRKISELSGGQKQRIAIARALIKKPSIILADEPTGALDSVTSNEIVSSLKSLAEDKLVIVVTHDVELAYKYGSYIVELNDGKVINRYRREENKEDNLVRLIDNKIVKVSGGYQFKDGKVLNNLLDKDKENNLCISTKPELFTIANSNLYDEIFKEEDYKSLFKEEKYEEINDETSIENSKNSSLKLKECFKMATKTYSKSFGRIIFLLLFTIISMCLTGITSSLYTTGDAKIKANALTSNDMNIAMMIKSSGEDITQDETTKLNNKYKNINFALSKEISISYEQAIQANSSAFSMQSFTGIVECENLEDLNLSMVYGTGKFESNSLDNDEIIISDYAAYELARTGFIGYDANDHYGIIRPNTVSDVLNSKVKLREKCYKIIGIFDTNYEDYLSLLVSETYSSSSKEESSLNALKSYYYARIFAPIGFYKNMYENNASAFEKELYVMYSDTVEIYNEDEEKYEKLGRMSTNYFDEFYSNFSFLERGVQVTWLKENYTVSSISRQGLSANQVIVNQVFLDDYGIKGNDGIDKFVETLQSVTIAKVDSNLNISSTVLKANLEVVAVVEFNYNSQDRPYFYFADDLCETLNNSKYNYSQILFTLSNVSLLNRIKILKMKNEGYTTLNIDGSKSVSSDKLSSFKIICLSVSLVSLLFSFLIILNFVSNSIKVRKKEIGILRATGACKKDIIKMFVVEEGILAIVIAFVASFILFYVANIINTNFGNVDIGIKVMIISPLNILIIFILSFALIFIATLIPVFKIASLKPIEAIRQN